MVFFNGTYLHDYEFEKLFADRLNDKRVILNAGIVLVILEVEFF